MTEEFEEKELQEYAADPTVEPQADMSAKTSEAMPGEKSSLMWLAVASILLTVISWAAAGYNAMIAVGVSAVAVVVGAMSLRSRRHGVRNTAITSIIAAAVLLVVIVAFLIVVNVGVKSI